MSVAECKVTQWVGRIREQYEQGDLTITASLVQQALLDTQHSPKILEIAGIVECERENYADAIDYIEQAMFELALSLDTQMALGKAYLRLGLTDQATTAYTFLVEMVSKLPCSMLPDLTQAVAKLERHDLALTVCREAFARHPEDDAAAFGAAFYMYRLGYPAELIKSVLEKAVELNPTSQVYRLNIAVACCTLSQFREAYEHAVKLSDRALRCVPHNCMRRLLCDLFQRFDDQDRFQLVSPRRERQK